MLIAVAVTVAALPPLIAAVIAKSATVGVVVGTSENVTCNVVALIALILPIFLLYFT
ncbi:hypothetical protein I6U48_13505 [Clostridium sp. PL3]|uniref:Uncharacterized protein n=1 Tax=Clostridium thailandense TaxID=2794346 RepID=A0A949X4F8_9CLOT|nr:hypothetical protein [Clostridium thailandense]MBV7273918.1 hypothetical protein [Clostridium thailandense]